MFSSFLSCLIFFNYNWMHRMGEEFKQQKYKLENLIGCDVKIDVTSKNFTNKLIEALQTKYKSDLEDTLHLHRLEMFYDLIENSKNKEQKTVEIEEQFVLSKSEAALKKEEEKEKDEHVELRKLSEDAIAITADNIDNWKDLMTLSKYYYGLEHPNSKNITWEENVTKKTISKFGDVDLVKWRAAQLFRLKSLEEWAMSRKQERKLSLRSSYSLDEDDDIRKLEDLFFVLDNKKQRKPEMTLFRKILSKKKKPFKLKDECLEDWTESYSEDSEESGADEIEEDVLEIPEEIDLKIGETIDVSKEPESDEEDAISEIFSSYKEIPPYKNPIFEELEKTKTLRDWHNLYSEKVDSEKESSPIAEKESVIKFLSTIHESPDERPDVEVITVEDISGTSLPQETPERIKTDLEQDLDKRVTVDNDKDSEPIDIEQEAKKALRKVISSAQQLQVSSAESVEISNHQQNEEVKEDDREMSEKIRHKIIGEDSTENESGFKSIPKPASVSFHVAEEKIKIPGEVSKSRGTFQHTKSSKTLEQQLKEDIEQKDLDKQEPN